MSASQIVGLVGILLAVLLGVVLIGRDELHARRDRRIHQAECEAWEAAHPDWGYYELEGDPTITDIL